MSATKQEGLKATEKASAEYLKALCDLFGGELTYRCPKTGIVLKMAVEQVKRGP